MKETTLYIKIDRNTVVQSPKVLLSDIAKIECERQDILRKVKNIVVYNFESAKTKQHYHSAVSMSILKVIEDIHEISSGSFVVNEGESDFVISYQGEQKQKKWLEKGKTIVLCVIVFFGSAFSINAFNNDVNIINVFNQFYYQVMGKMHDGISELEVCYCLGLAIGITVFFNHVGAKKITKDPTPLQVEMRKYENDLDMTFIENASRKEHNIDVD